MFYYEITKEGKVEETSTKRPNSAILTEHEVKRMQNIFDEYDIIGTDGSYIDMLNAVRELYATTKLDDTGYVNCSKAVVDGGFAMKARLDDPKYYVRLLASDNESYLRICRSSDNKVESIYFYGKEEEYLREQTKFTKSEIEEMKQDPKFNGIDFDNCLEPVEEC